jgi:hypothetical protein
MTPRLKQRGTNQALNDNCVLTAAHPLLIRGTCHACLAAATASSTSLDPAAAASAAAAASGSRGSGTPVVKSAVTFDPSQQRIARACGGGSASASSANSVAFEYCESLPAADDARLREAEARAAELAHALTVLWGAELNINRLTVRH